MDYAYYDGACPEPTPVPSEGTSSTECPLDMDLPCTDSKDHASITSSKMDSGPVNEATQTRRDMGVNTENPWSLTVPWPTKNQKGDDNVSACTEARGKFNTPPNPLLRLGKDGVYIRPKRQTRGREPVTGKRYKLQPAVPLRQLLYKYRIPPAGFSSGLW